MEKNKNEKLLKGEENVQSVCGMSKKQDAGNENVFVLSHTHTFSHIFFSCVNYQVFVHITEMK